MESGKWGTVLPHYGQPIFEGMIRLLTGMMLNVVRGKVGFEEAKSCLHQQKALKMVWSAPAEGLTLYGVDYEVPELPPFKLA